jgi:superfamily II DNA or RNA helicase
MIHKKRDEIQNLAVNAWVKADMKGTVFAHTGTGKMFIFIFAAQHLKPSSNILFLAETTVREKDLYENIEKYKNLFGYDLLANHKLTFSCYQSAYKWIDTTWDMVCADEIQDGLSKEYSKFFFNNNYKALLCLSATLDEKAVSYVEESGKEVTKADILAQIAPVCYRYDINQAQEDNTTRKLNVYVIMHRLDSVNKTIEAGSKLKRFKTTEKAAYDYWDNEFKKALFMPESIKEFKIRTSSAARAKVLYQLPSKVDACKLLLSNLNKTILFGNDLNSLAQITSNVVKGTNSEDKNRDIIKSFQDGKINDIASFKILKQGISIDGLENVIIHSYYTKELDFLQRVGRMRWEQGKEGNVFIFCTIGTVEEKWFNKMIENINLNITYCKDVNDCINKIK